MITLTKNTEDWGRYDFMGLWGDGVDIIVAINVFVQIQGARAQGYTRCLKLGMHDGPKSIQRFAMNGVI